jgi:hypothetical protein
VAVANMVEWGIRGLPVHPQEHIPGFAAASLRVAVGGHPCRRYYPAIERAQVVEEQPRAYYKSVRVHRLERAPVGSAFGELFWRVFSFFVSRHLPPVQL